MVAVPAIADFLLGGVRRTTVGAGLRGSPGKLAWASVLAASAVCANLALTRWGEFPWSLIVSLLLAAVSLAAFVYSAKGKLTPVGLRTRPRGGWLAWSLICLKIGSWFLLISASAAGVWWILGGRQEMPLLNPRDLHLAFLHLCILAPLPEEITFRVLICVPLAAWGRPATAIAASGILFAIAHVINGNPGADNLVAGFFLAWAFLKSGSLAVPVLLHTLGNILCLVAQSAGWYWLSLGR